MKKIIVLSKSDIQCRPVGFNLAIAGADDVEIILIPEAAEELVRDIAEWQASRVGSMKNPAPHDSNFRNVPEKDAGIEGILTNVRAAANDLPGLRDAPEGM